jgi:hypothetical protein
MSSFLRQTIVSFRRSFDSLRAKPKFWRICYGAN